MIDDHPPARRYSVAEIDRMRAALKGLHRLSFERIASHPGSFSPGGPEADQRLAQQVDTYLRNANEQIETELRTYMLAGIDPSELEARLAARDAAVDATVKIGRLFWYMAGDRRELIEVTNFLPWGGVAFERRDGRGSGCFQSKLDLWSSYRPADPLEAAAAIARWEADQKAAKQAAASATRAAAPVPPAPPPAAPAPPHRRAAPGLLARLAAWLAAGMKS